MEVGYLGVGNMGQPMAHKLPPRRFEWVVTTQLSPPQVFLCSAERRFFVPA